MICPCVDRLHDALAHYLEAYPSEGAWWVLRLVVFLLVAPVLVELAYQCWKKWL